jgi:uncharacterized YccA/Bax inhibitor family protein
METSNPALNQKIIRDFAYTRTNEGVMTIAGTINKVAILFMLTLAAAIFTWNKFVTAPDTLMVWTLVGGIGGFITALIIIFKKEKSGIFAPVYAIFEGLFLGAISAMFASMYEGIVLRAVMLTLAVLFTLLFAYKTGLIKVTEKFRAGVIAATIGIAVAYFFSFILGLFGMNLSFMHGSGLLSIGISVVIVGVAALNLVLDFDFIENGAKAGLPKYFEWYGAFGLMVTLIWLYLEILRLLSKLSGRD